MFREIKKGLCREVSLPVYGNQDIGISPGGAMDRFSYLTGNIILGNPDNATALEIILPPQLEITGNGYMVLTGAPTSGSIIKRDSEDIRVVTNRVFKVRAGDILSIGFHLSGFRSYLCYTDSIKGNPEGRERGEYKKIATWPSSDGRIRVIPGPEYENLLNREEFYNNYWVVSNETNSMGMRLNSHIELETDIESMVSEAVSDGTIQITPKGPIILLRDRQTIGGYPRCLNVIETDINMLAQYSPGQVIRFRLTTIKEAFDAAKNMKSDLNRLRNRF